MTEGHEIQIKQRKYLKCSLLNEKEPDLLSNERIFEKKGAKILT